MYLFRSARIVSIECQTINANGFLFWIPFILLVYFMLIFLLLIVFFLFLLDCLFYSAFIVCTLVSFFNVYIFLFVIS